MRDSTIYSFGCYAVDATRNVILKDRTIYSHDTKQAKLLYLLCKAYPDKISKDEIMEEIWSGQIVTDASISHLVSELRQTIGDDGKQQSFIKTEWGKGFRMTCQVSPMGEYTLSSFLTAFQSSARRFSVSARFATVILLCGAVVLAYQLSDNINLLPTTDNKNISLAIIPVNILTNDPADEWISLGVPSLISGYLQNYKNIESLSIKRTLNFLEDAGIDNSQIRSQESFNEICGVLGCTHLLYLEYKTTADGHSLGYQLISDDELSTYRDFNYIDVTVAAENVTNHISDRLLPRSEQRRSYAEFYSHDALANRSYAIASNDRLRGNLNEAEANFKLALQRDSNFFWAKWGLATLYYRKNEWELARGILEELEIDAENDPRKLGAIFQTRGSIEEARGNIKEAILLEKKAIVFYEKAGNTQGVANVKHNVGMALFDSGDIQGGLPFLLESLKLDMESGKKADIAISSYNVGRVYAALKQTEKARTLYHQSKEYAVTSKMALLATYSRAALAGLDVDTGVTSERLVLEYKNIVEEFTKLGHPSGALETRGELITLLQLRGQVEDAEDEVTSYIAEIDFEKFPLVMNKARYIAAEIYFNQNRFQEALDQLALLSGEWKPVEANRSLLKAKIFHAMGDDQQALLFANNIKLNLGDNWSDDHQAILEMIESKLAISVNLDSVHSQFD